ncbi:Metal tolerance protein 1, partial [Irineochytrium annulatum]
MPNTAVLDVRYREEKDDDAVTLSPGSYAMSPALTSSFSTIEIDQLPLKNTAPAADASRCPLEHSSRRREAGAVAARRKLIRAAAVCFCFFLIEFVGGIQAGSLAILSDSFHLLSDLAGFLISILAVHYARKPADATHTFGHARLEILGSLLSTLLIWALTGALVFEAFDRLTENSAQIDARIMVATASVGVIINL